MTSTGLAVVLLAACGSSPPAKPPMIEVADYATAPTHDLDVLVLIDNSNSTGHYQGSLGDAFPRLLDALAVVDGGFPNLHVGVATSDMGSSGGPAVGVVGTGGCAGQGDDGALKISGAPVTGTFLVDEADGQGGRTRNYSGSIQLALQAMFRVGSGGCGFEQDLAGLRRALARPDNAAFLRTGANLMTIVIGDEDDCSADGALFGNDPALGRLESFRCTTQGVVCDQPIDTVGAKTHCRGRTDSPFVEDVAVTVDFLNQVKAQPQRVATAVIAGPPEPFAIEARVAPGGGLPTPALMHSCGWAISTGPAVADPAVRLRDFAQAFGGRGTFTSICDVDLGPQLTEAARIAKQLFGTVCLDTSKLATQLGVPACAVDDDDTELPNCGADSTGACWELASDAVACPETPDHTRVVVHGAAGPHVVVRCQPAR